MNAIDSLMGTKSVVTPPMNESRRSGPPSSGFADEVKTLKAETTGPRDKEVATSKSNTRMRSETQSNSSNEGNVSNAEIDPLEDEPALVSEGDEADRPSVPDRSEAATSGESDLPRQDFKETDFAFGATTTAEPREKAGADEPSKRGQQQTSGAGQVLQASEMSSRLDRKQNTAVVGLEVTSDTGTKTTATSSGLSIGLETRTGQLSLNVAAQANEESARQDIASQGLPADGEVQGLPNEIRVGTTLTQTSQAKRLLPADAGLGDDPAKKTPYLSEMSNKLGQTALEPQHVMSRLQDAHTSQSIDTLKLTDLDVQTKAMTGLMTSVGGDTGVQLSGAALDDMLNLPPLGERPLSQVSAKSSNIQILGQTITGQPVGQAIAVAIDAKINGSGPDTIDLMLEPQELGRLRITMVSRETGLYVMLSAERAETVEILKRNSGELQSNLETLDLGGAHLGFEHRPDESNWQFDEDENSQFSETTLQQTMMDNLPETLVQGDDRLDLRL
ncbi:MAG: flagellar hook-length control protein FliK [Litoreibacter sp.]|nr:flagellar hook-length control protein FliK [Litoreibacter sp.]